nr:MAG TPA: hypothetical protein [Caudoviricetes sp.]
MLSKNSRPHSTTRQYNPTHTTQFTHTPKLRKNLQLNP